MGIGIGYRTGQTLGGGAGGVTTGRVPWPITSITDVPAGAADGDFGTLNGAPYVLRSVTLPDATTRLVWVDPSDATAAITVLAYADGDDDTPAGITVGETGTGSVTTDGTDVVLATTGSSSSATLITTGTLVPGSIVRVRLQLRSVAASTGDSFIVAIGDGTNQISYYLTTGTTPANRWQVVNAAAASLYASHAYRDGSVQLPALASDPALFEMRDDGSTVGCSTRYNGKPYNQSARLTSGTAPNFVDGVYIGVSSGGLGNGHEARIRNLLIYTVTP